MIRPHRWSDRDRYLGPFTFARNHSWRPVTLALRSADEDGTDNACLLVSLYWFTILLALPGWVLRPARRWVSLTNPFTPSDGYWHTIRREYGFTYCDGHLSLHYGRQTNDSSTDQRKGWFVPWKEWRHVRRSFYTPKGEHLFDAPKRERGMTPQQRSSVWDHERTMEEATPRLRFFVLDFDQEKIVASCHIEEREWRWGAGVFRFLSWMRKPRIERSLMLNFSSEVGKRKGSWKGGTLGHSIGMKPGEDPQGAFMRYCEENELTFAGRADHYLVERYGIDDKPEGWNDAVLAHFHEGIEARAPTEDFKAGFQQAVAKAEGEE